MADWDASIEELIEERDLWIEEYGIKWTDDWLLEELTMEKLEELKKLDEQKLVWTNHQTCEDDYWTPGLHIFGDCQLLDQKAGGCGCWQTYSFLVAEKPWVDEDERIAATASLPCPVCNADGEGEGDDECEGPEIPEGVDGGECNGGYVSWFLD